jgi:hypothetical protein
MSNDLPVLNEVERQPPSPPSRSRRPASPGADSPEAPPQTDRSATAPRRRRRGLARRGFATATTELVFI